MRWQWGALAVGCVGSRVHWQWGALVLVNLFLRFGSAAIFDLEQQLRYNAAAVAR